MRRKSSRWRTGIENIGERSLLRCGTLLYALGNDKGTSPRTIPFIILSG